MTNNRRVYMVVIGILLVALFGVGCPINGPAIEDDTGDPGGGAENQPPYPVTGPTQEPTFQAYTSADQEYPLEIEKVGGQSDPDGDQVFFRSSALPSYMTLDADTGLVTILGDPTFAGPPPGTVEVEFWSEDEHGADTSDAPYLVTFTLSTS